MNTLGVSLRVAFDRALQLVEDGGPLMLPLLLCGALLGGTLVLRAVLLRRGATWAKAHALLQDAPSLSSSLSSSLSPSMRAALQRDALTPLFTDLAFGKSIARSLIVVAPLLGLLGTVSGMIETFQSLADGALHSHDGGIAAGIAEALLTTELGLAVAIPGLLLSRLLDRREAMLVRDVDTLQLKRQHDGLRGPLREEVSC
jgi:biopolymer transport protein ExbB